MQRMRFLRKKQTVVRRPSGRRTPDAPRSTSLPRGFSSLAGRVGGIATGPFSILGGIRGSIHARGAVLLSAALLTGIVCVWQHVYAARLAGEIDQLRGRRGRLEAEIGFLEMECVTLSSRERIERYAMQHLDMRYPNRDEVVRLGRTQARAAGADYVMGDGRVRTDG